MRWAFDNFVLDTDRQELLSGDRRIPVEPKVLEFVRLLIENAGRVVAKARIFEVLWPDSVTTDSSLTRIVSLARRALADRDRSQPIIRTVHRRGYQLAVPVVRCRPLLTTERGAGARHLEPAPAALGDAFDAGRSRLFVGRVAELARLEMLLQGAAGVSLIHVFGPGGVGKSELLAALTRRAVARGAGLVRVDCAQIDPTEEGLREALGVATVPLPGRPALLVLDSLEYVTHLEHWLRNEFLPSLGTFTRVVSAGRLPLVGAWKTDAAWRDRVETIELENLGRSETIEYLDRCGVPAEHHDAVYESCFGHPLALALVGEVLAATPGARPSLDELPEVVQSLVRQFLREVPGQRRRLALWSCALVWGLDEDLLRAMLGEPDVTDLFEWLSRLSFVRWDVRGLVPHDLARAAIEADLKWRAPETRIRLAERAIDRYATRLVRTPERAVDLFLQADFLMRDFADHLFAGIRRDFYPSPFRAPDWPAIEEMIRSREGPTSVMLARSWREASHEIVVARGPDGMAAGMVFILWLDRVTPEQAARDPGVAALHAHLQETGALESGPVLYARWSTHVTDVASPSSTALLGTLQAYKFTHRIALGCVSFPDLGEREDEHRRRHLDESKAHLTHFAAGDFELAGRRYLVLGRDFRKVSGADWYRQDMLRALHSSHEGRAPSA